MLRRSRTKKQHEIERQVKTEPATYVIFDILEKDEESLVGLPLLERKRILKASVKEGRHCCLADYIDSNGEDYFQLIAAHGLEGVVAKRKDSIYEQGVRSDCWLKIKNLQTCDVVLMGYGFNQDGFYTKAYLYDQGEPVFVGNVQYGFSAMTRKVLLEFFKEIELKRIKDITWVKPVVVCEVSFQSLFSNGVLRFPRFLRIRFDKSPEECTIDQLPKLLEQSLHPNPAVANSNVN